MLKQEQVDFYHEKGYLGVEDVLSQEEVEDLQQVTDEFVETEASSAVSVLRWRCVAAVGSGLGDLEQNLVARRTQLRTPGGRCAGAHAAATSAPRGIVL